MGVGPGTEHGGCGGRYARTWISGKPGVRCGRCGRVVMSGTMVDRGVRVAVPWEQTEKEANRK